MDFPLSSTVNSRQLYFRLIRYVRPSWRVLLLGLVLSALAAAMEPILPAMMRPLIDNGFAPKEGAAADRLLQHSPWIAPLAIIGLVLIRGIVGFLANYAMSWVQARLINDMRQKMFDHMMQLPAEYFQATPSSRTITRFTNDANNISMAATTVGVTVIRESFAIMGLLGWMFYLNWKLTLLTLTVAPLIAWVTKVVGQRLRALSRSWQTEVGVMTESVHESILCHKIVKVFGGQLYETDRFDRSNGAIRRNAMRSAIASAAGTPMVQFFVSIAIGMVVFIALIQSSSGETTVGSFVSFITAMLMLLAPLRALSGVNIPLQRGLAAAESVFELLDAPVEKDTGTKRLEKAKGKIEFRDVSFAYPNAERLALDRINLHIMPGQTVALVGPSGGGKSTIAALLPRFHHPSSGSILIDDVDIHDLQLFSLRHQMALVPQETLLFNDTVRANIAYGSSANVSDEALEAAAEGANALGFIRNLPEGFNTVIGENGSRLSGGQRQRIAIARAMLKDAPILILDEATSALDNESERLVQEALEKLMKHRTTLVIAHRLSTIERADQIVVLDQGRVVEMGRHRELLERDGVYAQLHQQQFLAPA